MTDPELLLNPNTPQGEAFEWLDTVDTGTDVCTYPTTKQRYSLAVLYYATNGTFWNQQTGWLSGLPECTWFQVTCDEVSDLDAIKIDLGKHFFINILKRLGQISHISDLILLQASMD